MRALAVLAVIAATMVGCGGGTVFRQYEYEEEMYLSLDGSATVYVNSSVPALNTLRGTSLDPSPTSRFDRAAVRQIFETPATRVTRISTSRRRGRRFVHVRLEVADVRRLGEAAPFAWSTYDFRRDGNLLIYRQWIGTSADAPGRDAGLTGDEIVAFRLHLPSRITYHNAQPGNLRRGNILVWEQALAQRLQGAPLALDARMETQSILYHTLWLFGAATLLAAATFGVAIWWVAVRGVRTRAAGHAGAP